VCANITTVLWSGLVCIKMSCDYWCVSWLSAVFSFSVTMRLIGE